MRIGRPTTKAAQALECCDRRYGVVVTQLGRVRSSVRVDLWFLRGPDYEAGVSTLALLATTCAIFADRWAAVRERRGELLRALKNELFVNLAVVNDLVSLKQAEKVTKPHIYPRFHVSSLEAAIASGFFVADRMLWSLMYEWLREATSFNIRLTMSELHAFQQPAQAQHFNVKATEGDAPKVAIGTLGALVKLLLDRYREETGIDSTTVMFPPE